MKIQVNDHNIDNTLDLLSTIGSFSFNESLILDISQEQSKTLDNTFISYKILDE